MEFFERKLVTTQMVDLPGLGCWENFTDEEMSALFAPLK
jgi:hypothetical protein